MRDETAQYTAPERPPLEVDWMWVGAFVLALVSLVGFGVFVRTAMVNGHEDYLAKLEVCKTIEEPAARTICVRGTG